MLFYVQANAGRLDPDHFIELLGEVALNHRATRHPYLEALGEGCLPSPTWALKDFARGYWTYSKAFPNYLRAVLDHLAEPEHRRALEDNLVEECGSYDEDSIRVLAEEGVEAEWVMGVSHPTLFQRFARSTGLPDRHAPLSGAVTWRDSFLELVSRGPVEVSVGALGLGTEHIVSTVYQPLVRAAHDAGIDARDSVFFLLHTKVDDDHGVALSAIARDLASTAEGQSQLASGALQALELRARFWDYMLMRSLRRGTKAQGAL